VPKAVNRSGFYDKHNCPQRDSIPGPRALQSGIDHCDLQPINEAVRSFTLNRSTGANGGHFKHTEWLSDIRQLAHCAVSRRYFVVFWCKCFTACETC